MTWLQIELQATPAQLPDAEDLLLASGAVSITLVSDADEPVLEPAPGETPLWSNVRVQALFPLDTDMAALRAQLGLLHGGLGAKLNVAFIAAQDWQVAATNHAVNRVFANRLWLLPKDTQVSDEDNLVKLRLEPGLAFGSGSHPTTRLCLQWLAEHVQPGQRVLDFGCGSGVLAIAAALLGADVVAVDHDDQAVMATQDNAAYNGVADRLSVLSLSAWQERSEMAAFDVVVANILAAPLQTLAPQFEAVSRPGGAVVLSGVLQEQAASVMSSYLHTEFQAPIEEAGWACLVGSVICP